MAPSYHPRVQLRPVFALRGLPTADDPILPCARTLRRRITPVGASAPRQLLAELRGWLARDRPLWPFERLRIYLS